MTRSSVSPALVSLQAIWCSPAAENISAIAAPLTRAISGVCSVRNIDAGTLRSTSTTRAIPSREENSTRRQIASLFRPALRRAVLWKKVFRRRSCAVIPYGVRLDSFQPLEGSTRAADTFDILFVGQVSLRKGVPYLLEAFAKVRHPRKRLRILGPMFPHMKPLLAHLRMEHVEIVGAVSRQELVRYFSSSHAMVLPSLEEGLALVQGEAMACGCPVIATPNTGSEDLFTDGKEGFIVPPRDAIALADRLQQLADDPALQQQMSAAALDRVQHLGGWNDYGDRWAQLLQEICRP